MDSFSSGTTDSTSTSPTTTAPLGSTTTTAMVTATGATTTMATSTTTPVAAASSTSTSASNNRNAINLLLDLQEQNTPSHQYAMEEEEGQQMSPWPNTLSGNGNNNMLELTATQTWNHSIEPDDHSHHHHLQENVSPSSLGRATSTLRVHRPSSPRSRGSHGHNHDHSHHHDHDIEIGDSYGHNPVKKEPRDWRQWKLVLFANLLFIFCLCELIFGLYANSLVLVTDSVHLLSDVFALVIGFMALRYSKKGKSPQYTYGWKRFELIGGLANACFLLAVCVFIFLEAAQRFIEYQEVNYTMIIVYVGCGGVALNFFGLLLFGGHAHGHSHGGGHGHSHGGGHGHSHGHSNYRNLSDDSSEDDEDDEEGEGGKKLRVYDLNMRAVFVHILGDFMSSIGIITSGLLETYLKWEYRFYIDPMVSTLIAILIFISTIPVLKQCIKVLLQSIPTDISLPYVERTLRKIQGVLGVHELHAWQLQGSINIASVHLVVDKRSESPDILRAAQEIFHANHIHSTTIQLEVLGGDFFPQDCQDLTCKSEFCSDSKCCKVVETDLQDDF